MYCITYKEAEANTWTAREARPPHASRLSHYTAGTRAQLTLRTWWGRHLTWAKRQASPREQTPVCWNLKQT